MQESKLMLAETTSVVANQSCVDMNDGNDFKQVEILLSDAVRLSRGKVETNSARTTE